MGIRREAEKEEVDLKSQDLWQANTGGDILTQKCTPTPRGQRKKGRERKENAKAQKAGEPSGYSPWLHRLPWGKAQKTHKNPWDQRKYVLPRKRKTSTEPPLHTRPPRRASQHRNKGLQ